MDFEGKVIEAQGQKYLVVKTLNYKDSLYGFLTNIENQKDSFFAVISSTSFDKVDNREIIDALLSIIAVK